MLLKRLEVVGFKSFATRTATECPPGIVVVVGPNGSGKSNIADAVRWVLGEQSTRAVRAKRSEDVIFAGSTERQPLGMAEVSLVLDNSDHAVPIDFSELRVTRRLYRSGESEYLVNNARVRLKDVSGYLLHAGLGPDSYSVIGQGSVDELILQRPEERRVAFENAADIRRHQVRLTDTRGKLAATEANLVRVQDVLAELAPHVRRLKAQSERAERADSLRTELHDLLVRSYRHQLIQARREQSAAEQARARAQHELDAAMQASASAQARWEQDQQRLAETEEQIVVLRARVDAFREQRRAAERGLAVAEERLSALASQRDLLSGQAAQHEAHIAALRGEVASLEAPGREEASPSDGAEMADLRVALHEARQALDGAQADVARLRRAREESERAIPQTERDLAAIEERLRRAEAEAAAESARREARSARVQELEAAVASQEVALEGHEQLNARVRAEHTAALERKRVASQQLARAQETLRQAAQQLNHLRGGLEALGATEAVGAQPLDPTWQVALEGLAVLGTAAELAQRVRPLDDLLRAYLGRVVVVADDATAREAHRRLAGLGDPANVAWAVLSVDGLIVGADGERPIVPSSDAQATALADWRERVRSLEREQDEARSRQTQAEDALAQARELVAGADVEEYEARAQVHAAEAACQQAQRTLQQSRTELQSAQSELRRLARREEELRAAHQQHEARVVRLRESVASARATRQDAEQRLDGAEKRAASALESAEDLRRRLGALEAEATRRKAERDARATLLARARGELSTAIVAQEAAARRLEQIGPQVDALERQRAHLHEESAAVVITLAPLETSLAQQEQERSTLAGGRRDAERWFADMRATERAAQERREAAALRVQRARDELERLEREVADSGESESDANEPGESAWTHQLRLALLEEPVPVVAELSPQELDSMRRRIATLRRELRSIGGVGGSVLDEYRELSDRHDFLQQQSADLRSAMAELRTASVELEEHMRARFEEVFAAVNEAFQACFTRLFNGGDARLVLTQPDDLLTTGIEIVARPPGKKLQGLLSLSGGERALTIVALLFGLLRVNPTPFCVLDEVDAALDEANVQRFADLLAEFSKRIQFIVVTHNRATMEMADAMYGVTMDQYGISRIYSLQPRAVASTAVG